MKKFCAVSISVILLVTVMSMAFFAKADVTPIIIFGDSKISEITITDAFVTPVAGDAVEDHWTYTIPANCHFTESTHYWYCEDPVATLYGEETFEKGRQYDVLWTFKADEGYTFADTVTVTINGTTVAIDSALTKRDAKNTTLFSIWTKPVMALPKEVINATYSANLTLNKSIDVNFTMSNIPSATREKLSITVDGNAPEYTLSSGVATCVLKAVEPKKIDEKMHVVVTYDDVVVKEFDYSVAAYCERAFAAYADEPTAYADLNTLCEAILNYGKYAADFSSGNTASTLNAGHELNLNAISLPTSKRNVVENDTYGGDGSGAYLEIGSTIKLNYLVKTTKFVYDNATAETQNFFILNEDDKQIATKKVAVSEVDGGYRISVDLFAYQLANEYTLKVKDVELKDFCITYSVYDYCTEIQAKSGEKYTATLKSLCKAIYAYSEAVQGYNG